MQSVGFIAHKMELNAVQFFLESSLGLEVLLPPATEPVLHSGPLLPAWMGHGTLESHSCICCCTAAANPAQALGENMIASQGTGGVTAQAEKTI